MGMHNPSVSSDGKKVIVDWSRPPEGLWLLSLIDSTQVLLAEKDYVPIAWSSDGKWIYVSEINGKNVKVLKIHTVTNETNTVTVLPFEIDFMDLLNANISMAPDGKRFVCTVFESKSDVWLVENFDLEVE